MVASGGMFGKSMEVGVIEIIQGSLQISLTEAFVIVVTVDSFFRKGITEKLFDPSFTNKLSRVTGPAVVNLQRSGVIKYSFVWLSTMLTLKVKKSSICLGGMYQP